MNGKCNPDLLHEQSSCKNTCLDTQPMKQMMKLDDETRRRNSGLFSPSVLNIYVSSTSITEKKSCVFMFLFFPRFSPSIFLLFLSFGIFLASSYIMKKQIDPTPTKSFCLEIAFVLVFQAITCQKPIFFMILNIE